MTLKWTMLLLYYYGKLAISENFKLAPTAEDAFMKLLNIAVTRATEIDQISGKYLKNGAQIFAKPIIELRIFLRH